MRLAVLFNQMSGGPCVRRQSLRRRVPCCLWARHSELWFHGCPARSPGETLWLPHLHPTRVHEGVPALNTRPSQTSWGPVRTGNSQSGALDHQQSGTLMRGWCQSCLCGHNLSWTPNQAAGSGARGAGGHSAQPHTPPRELSCAVF